MKIRSIGKMNDVIRTTYITDDADMRNQPELVQLHKFKPCIIHSMSFKTTGYFAIVAALIPLAIAQSPEWGQCGGIGWTGPTTCVAGTTCVESNPYYSQCLPGVSSNIFILVSCILI